VSFVTLFKALRASADGASLALFRILYGLSLLAGLWLLWGQLKPLYLAPKFHFSYTGFAWVQAWPGAGLQWQLGFMALCAAAISLGIFYRVACALFFAGAAYLFLIERTLYQDVLYLALAFSLLMCFVPAHRAWSLDSRRSQPFVGGAPRWASVAVQCMLATLLLAAALAFVQIYRPDAGTTLADQLKAAGAQPAVYALMFSAAGLLILITPSWPRRLVARLRGGKNSPVPAAGPAHLATPALAALVAFVLFHALFPLRVLIPHANTGWIDANGQLLTVRECRSIFNASDPTRSWNVDPGTRLSPHQVKMFAREPELVHQFAEHLVRHFAHEKYAALRTEVRARIKCTSDGHRWGMVLDPKRDLARLTSDELLQARIPFNTDSPERPRELRLKRKPVDAPPADMRQ
jgi:hypothetical protein